MTVRLRPHHLLCLLTYVGKGYSPAFTANYDAIAMRIEQGEELLIVSGPDDRETLRNALRDGVRRRVDEISADSLD